MSEKLITAEDINLQDWFGTRFLNYIPVHFVTVKFRHGDERLRTLNWLIENTNSRFGIAFTQDEKPINSHSNHFVISDSLEIGFEDPAEATMYSMFFQ